jgi:hypothetical protein
MLCSLCLTRQCLGLTTRIECLIRPLSADGNTWTLLFAAGMSGEQPSSIRTQGPFAGASAAQAVMLAVAESLSLHGYRQVDDLLIWSLHLQGELRRISRDVSRLQRSSPF